MKSSSLMKIFNAFLAMMLAVAPAFAGDTYLIFPPGQDRSTDIWQGTAPVVGQNVANGSIVKEWVVVDGDTYPGNYKLQGGSIVHSVPVVAPPVVDVNAPQWEVFKTEVFLDDTINLVARIELSKMYPLMDDNVTKPELFQAFWMGLKAVAPMAYPWLDLDTITKVEAHATTRHIPFTAQ